MSLLITLLVIFLLCSFFIFKYSPKRSFVFIFLISLILSINFLVIGAYFIGKDLPKSSGGGFTGGGFGDIGSAIEFLFLLPAVSLLSLPIFVCLGMLINYFKGKEKKYLKGGIVCLILIAFLLFLIIPFLGLGIRF